MEKFPGAAIFSIAAKIKTSASKSLSSKRKYLFDNILAMLFN
jgi:hypothetical protein